jgi:hypothetical protein
LTTFSQYHRGGCNNNMHQRWKDRLVENYDRTAQTVCQYTWFCLAEALP